MSLLSHHNHRLNHRLLVACAIACLLTACATGPATKPVDGPPAAATPAPAAEPPPSQASPAPAPAPSPPSFSLRPFIAVTPARLTERFGRPGLVRREGSGELWQYVGGPCVLLFFIYDMGQGQRRVTHAEARTSPGPWGPAPPVNQACLAAFGPPS